MPICFMLCSLWAMFTVKGLMKSIALGSSRDLLGAQSSTPKILCFMKITARSWPPCSARWATTVTSCTSFGLALEIQCNPFKNGTRINLEFVVLQFDDFFMHWTAHRQEMSTRFKLLAAAKPYIAGKWRTLSALRWMESFMSLCKTENINADHY